MVEAVLDALEGWMNQNILQALKASGDPLSRFEQMCDRLSEVYEEGTQPCLSAILLLGSARDIFHDRVKVLYRAWIEAIAEVLVTAGLDHTAATQRGEDAVITIQGSLILSQGLNDSVSFQRAIKQLPQQLCRDLNL
ncbi:transcriptional regulator, TetR family [Leptolyngbya sp. NIES-2104]|nr:transcriptional regulator, TetR family [Leptolyngbya sp. NIES-2104]